jgi:hypothetical protein
MSSVLFEDLFLSLVLYQVEYNCRSHDLKQASKYGTTDYKSVKEMILGLSYIDAIGYTPQSLNVFNPNDSLNYGVYGTGVKYNVYKNLDDYDLNHQIFNSRPDLKAKIKINFDYAKVLDIAMDYDELTRNGSNLLPLIARRSNSLFKGISHRTIPNDLLDNYGIIKDGSELNIPFYNSTTTNIALAIFFAYYNPTIAIPNPSMSSYQSVGIDYNPLLNGGVGLEKTKSVKFTAAPLPSSQTRVDVFTDVKNNLQMIKKRIPSNNPKKLIEFVKDDYYIRTQQEIRKINPDRTHTFGGKKKKGGDPILFKDSGHFFLINEIDPNLKAFDFFDFMVYGEPKKLRNKYFEQVMFMNEQEILFNRLTKLSNIQFIGAITYIDSNCRNAPILENGEILLCTDGCLYNNKGKLSCSINILTETGLVDISNYYGNSAGALGTHIGLSAATVNNILGIKIYTCKLEPFDKPAVAISTDETIIEDTSNRVKLLLTDEYIESDKLNELPEEEINTIIKNSGKKFKKYEGIIGGILDYLSDLIDGFEYVCDKTVKSAEHLTRLCCIAARAAVGEKQEYCFGGSKISKITLIENIAKITPYIKGLSKMKKESLTNIYNQLAPLNKYKKEELIKKYIIKDKNLKKNEIIYMIFNSSNNR